jgi:hypothetical protein
LSTFHQFDITDIEVSLLYQQIPAFTQDGGDIDDAR